MRKLIIALLGACLSLPALATTGYTNILGTLVTDASGGSLASGTATFRVVDAGGHPLAVKLVNGGQIITAPVSVAVTYGAFSAQVVDVSQTQPQFPCVSLTIVDNSTGDTVWQNGCLQPTGGTYDLDNFSTNVTPIAPQAGDNIQGDLSVNGNFSATGNFSIGGLSAATINGTTITGSVNGVLNAAKISGPDICQDATTAFTSSNHVYIPSGSYTCSNKIVIPSTVRATLEMDPTTTITYTGTDTAIEWLSGGGGMKISGGNIVGNANARSGIRLDGAGQNFEIDNVGISGFTGGDCIINRGDNVGLLLNDNCQHNRVGFHNLGRPGFASNLVTVMGGVYANNQWGAVDGDVSQYGPSTTYGGGGITYGAGTQSPNFGSAYINVDWEQNTSGGVWLVLTSSAKVIGGYFEGDAEAVKLGGATPTTDATYQNLYGVTGTNGGTNVGTSITGAFMNDGAVTREVEISAAGSYSIYANSIISGAHCFVDLTSADWQPGWLGPNSYTGGSAPACQSGTAGGAVAKVLEFIDQANGLTTNQLNVQDAIYFNSSSFATSGELLFKANAGGPPRVGHGGTTTFCTPAWKFGSIWSDANTGAVFVCQADSIAPGGGAGGNAADGNGTWVELTYKAPVD